jgi:rhamnogalacturonyl hydrolase YesR
MFGGTAAMLARLTGESRYLDEALRMVHKIDEWCKDTREGIYFFGGKPGWHHPVKWGRGHAWALLGVLDVLENLPENHSSYKYMTDILKDSLEGLLKYQNGNGTWPNVLDNPISMPDTSCTCKFASVYGRAFWKGWLRDERVLPMLERAWFGLKSLYWKDKLLSWCDGTASVNDVLYYLRRPHVAYLPFAALWSGVELQRAKKVRENRK